MDSFRTGDSDECNVVACVRYRMITTKPRGSVSAVQPDSRSQPVFADDFPDTCLLSKFVSFILIVLCFFKMFLFAFSDLTLSIWRWEEHPACKNWVMRCWHGYVSGARCRLFVYYQLMPMHHKTSLSLASFISRLVLPSWYQLTQVVLEKRPLNGCRVVVFMAKHYMVLIFKLCCAITNVVLSLAFMKK